MNAKVQDPRVIKRERSFWVVDKPIGMPTYQTGCMEWCSDRYQQRLFPVHRIDADTSGLVIFALDPKTASFFTEGFRKRAFQKEYLAWCVGHPPKRGSCKEPLTDSKGKEPKSAHTDFEVMKTKGPFSLLRVTPHTGRFHQIRRHMDRLGFPLVGDPKYGSTEQWLDFFKSESLHRLMLHAWRIKGPHPERNSSKNAPKNISPSSLMQFESKPDPLFSL